jgi:ABC-2 type transport system permease protein
LISVEQEQGIWSLLRSQAVSIVKIIAFRLALRYFIILALATLLLCVGCFYWQSPFDIRLLYAFLLTTVYLTFWFALTGFVIFFQKSSTFNALSLLGIWIFLTILAPALLSLLISTTLPVSESFEVTVSQREGYHQKWDKPKAETMEKFYLKYPEYQEFPVPQDKFSWGWYYAMQNSGDEESSEATLRYMEKLEKRNYWTNFFARFLPTVNAQLAFNSLGKNDLDTHLAYLQSVREHHQKVREFFYPFIFRNAKVEEINWQNVPQHEFDSEKREVKFPANSLFILLISLILAVSAITKAGSLPK